MTTDLVDQMRADAGLAKAHAAESRARNRATFTFAATCMDAFAHMNPTLKYARQGDREIGKRAPDGMDWFATAPYRRGK